MAENAGFGSRRALCSIRAGGVREPAQRAKAMPFVLMPQQPSHKAGRVTPPNHEWRAAPCGLELPSRDTIEVRCERSCPGWNSRPSQAA
jgi:hypothetical protein